MLTQEDYVNAIIQEAKKKGDVYEVQIEVGELARIVPKQLQKKLQETTQWRVLMTEKESKVGCLCGYVGKAKVLKRSEDEVMYTCPKCNSSPAILDGDNIVLKDVKYR